AASGSRLVQQTRETVPAKSATSPEIRAKIARKRKLGDRTGTEVPRDTQETPRNVRRTPRKQMKRPPVKPGAFLVRSAADPQNPGRNPEQHQGKYPGRRQNQRG